MNNLDIDGIIDANGKILKHRRIFGKAKMKQKKRK